MPSVAETVIVFNASNRAFIVGDVEVLPQTMARVPADDEFLSILVERGDFALKPQPVEMIEEPEEAKIESATPKKASAKNTKGDE